MKVRDIKLENRFTAAFAADPETGNHRRQVTGLHTPGSDPKGQDPQLAVSQTLAEQLDLQWSEDSAEDWAEVFSGSKIGEAWKPYAACYGGHQFGQWAGQLGDGRAINLGELSTQGPWPCHLQLKGAGPTPYSKKYRWLCRLRSSVENSLQVKPCIFLGIPTTKGHYVWWQQVIRCCETWCTMAVQPTSRGPLLCRVAPDFIRFGNFEIFCCPSEHELLRAMADYTITHHYAFGKTRTRNLSCIF